MMKRAALFLITLMIRALGVVGQNLVQNPGFEQFPDCPERPSSNEDPIVIDHWFSPTLGTPDLYSACGFEDGMHVPKNYMGRAEAKEGRSYVGLLADVPFQWQDRPYSEYITNRLRSPLRRGTLYRLSYSVRAVDLSMHFTTTFSFAFSEDSLFFNEGILAEHMNYQTISILSEVAATSQWVTVEKVFRAEGGERFLTVGHFMPRNESHFIKRRVTIKNQNTALYYIYDDFMLEPLTIFGQQLSDKKPVSLDNVYFAHDSDSLDARATAAVDSLAVFLETYGSFSVTVLGYADPSGTDEYNLDLSKRRAKAVCRRLIENGVDSVRLQATGMGEEGSLSKSMARRVALRLLVSD